MIGDIPMRRFESQIHDRKIITAILDQIQIVTVGINDGDYPYVVPLSFGYEATEEKLLVYVHCAREGHKAVSYTHLAVYKRQGLYLREGVQVKEGKAAG